MKRILAAMVAGLLLAPPAATAGDLTLRDVLELHRTGLGDDLLIAVIDADGGPFRLSSVDILDLKGDGLSERVIAALVRTGARWRVQETEDGAVEPVRVYQEVVPSVPTVIVVGVPVIPSGIDRHHPGRESRAEGHSRRSEPPPATWVTRRDDGRNVEARSRPTRSSVPAATWVTPRDPQPRVRGGAPDAATPTPD